MRHHHHLHGQVPSKPGFFKFWYPRVPVPLCKGFLDSDLNNGSREKNTWEWEKCQWSPLWSPLCLCPLGPQHSILEPNSEPVPVSAHTNMWTQGLTTPPLMTLQYPPRPFHSPAMNPPVPQLFQDSQEWPWEPGWALDTSCPQFEDLRLP